MNRKRIIYFDSCCYSRLFDINARGKVKAQAAMIRHIINNRIKGGYVIAGSFAVNAEIRKTRSAKKRKAIEKLYYGIIANEIVLSAQSITRAVNLSLIGLGKMDSFHLAAAEAAGADFLITTDEKFIKKCRNRNITAVKVINPLDF